MKRKITQKYMQMFTVSIMFIIAIWGILTYVFILSEDVVNSDSPQYLINRFGQYLDYSSELKINDEGKTILLKNDLWAQIVDGNGKVLESYNTPEIVPDSYNIFQITKYAMNSNELGNQTLFIVQLEETGDCGVIIGCDSSKVNKKSIKLTGGVLETITKSILILVVVFVATGFFAGIIFLKNISKPVSEIIQKINMIEMEENDFGRENKDETIFKTVFDSLEKLHLRLLSVDAERRKVEKQRDEWIANISHDLKTPLSTIQGYAEIMEAEDYEITDEERKLYSKKILKNTNIIKSLVEELKFGRLLKNGEINLQKEEVNICSLVRECCDNIPIHYGECKISFDFEREIVYAMIDKQLMRRCFMNIICNALIHNNGNVDIVIKCYQTEKINIAIIDNGKGMSKDEKDNIFTRYYRGKTSEESVGTGLGLAITKEIICAHHGEINVDSQEGKGSKFVISI